MASEKIFVAIAGNIGTGKTSLCQMLSARFGWVAHYEAVGDNPYLVDFYKNMERWSFPLQVYFLTHRFKSHQGISQGIESAVQDRSIYEDAHIFARNLFEKGQMERRDYDNYVDLYRCMCKSLNPPDLMVYLKKSLPGLKSGIVKRGRDFEKEIADEYLSSLNYYYDDWISNYSIGKKLIITADQLDFVNFPSDFNQISAQILDALDQKDFFLQSKQLDGQNIRK